MIRTDYATRTGTIVTDMAKYLGATFSLLMTLGSAVGCVMFALMPHLGGAVCLGAMALISGYVVVANDWPKVWKPLLGL